MALKLLFQEDLSVQTMATDGTKILYNPTWIYDLPINQVAGVICHEIMHCILSHNTRRNNRDSYLWNIACDYAVNNIISKAEIELPAYSLINRQYDNMTAEKIYDELMKKSEQTISSMSKNQFGDIRDFKGTDVTISEQERHWKMSAAMASISAEAIGKMPESLKRIIEELLNPKLPWKEILNRFIIEKAKDDFSWSIPNKRYIWSGTYLPSLESLRLKPIGIAVDTSGSIDNKLFTEFISEIKSILSMSPGSRAHIVYVDSKVQGTDILTAESDTLNPIGRGGTDFVPAFEYFDKLDEDLSCILYFTDGFCDSFPKDCDRPCLWIVYGYKNFTPPFGEVINISR